MIKAAHTQNTAISFPSAVSRNPPIVSADPSPTREVPPGEKVATSTVKLVSCIPAKAEGETYNIAPIEKRAKSTNIWVFFMDW